MPGLSYRIRGDQGEMAGFIKLERCLLSKSIFNNEKLLKVWIWCLLKATYKEYTEMIGRQEVVIQPGQFTTGRFKAGEELNMNSSTAWSYLKLLQKNQSIGIKSNNKFSVVTIVNWALYQLDKDNSDNKSDNKKTTDEQQMNTNKNIKNDKKIKKEDGKESVPHSEVLETFNRICVSFAKVQKMTDSRKDKLRTRWPEFKTMETFEDICQKMESSSFLKGNNPRKWKATLDWLLDNDNNWVKVVEGQYIDKLDNQSKSMKDWK